MLPHLPCACLTSHHPATHLSHRTATSPFTFYLPALLHTAFGWTDHVDLPCAGCSSCPNHSSGFCPFLIHHSMVISSLWARIGFLWIGTAARAPCAAPRWRTRCARFRALRAARAAWRGAAWHAAPHAPPPPPLHNGMPLCCYTLTFDTNKQCMPELAMTILFWIS